MENPGTAGGYRYQAVADRIQTMIREGTLKEGSRIPSLREMSSTMGVSLNTVREAYSNLEAQYLIEAVPQSGYYVRSLKEELQALPARDPSAMDPREFSLCRIFASYQESGCRRSEHLLGISDLNSELYPAAQLAKAMQDVIRNQPDEAFGYQMPPGYLPLREHIARISGEEGTPLHPDELVMTNGCHEAVFMALQVLCRPGDTVAVESPCYFNIFQMLERLNLKVVEIPAVTVEGFSLDTLRFVLENHPVKVFLCISNFSNPLGYTLPAERKKRLVDLLREFDVPMIEDDIYGSLYFGKERPVTCRSLAEPDRVILCSSFSKVLGPGLRTGWIAAGKYTEEIIRLKTLLNLGNAPLLQIGLSRFLDGRGYVRHLKRLRAHLSRQIFRARRVILDSFPAGTTVSQPEGGLVLWVTLPGRTDTMELYSRSVKENIIFAPGRLFSLKRDYSSCLRLNTGCWDERVERAVRRLGELAREQAEG